MEQLRIRGFSIILTIAITLSIFAATVYPYQVLFSLSVLFSLLWLWAIWGCFRHRPFCLSSRLVCMSSLVKFMFLLEKLGLSVLKRASQAHVKRPKIKKPLKIWRVKIARESPKDRVDDDDDDDEMIDTGERMVALVVGPRKLLVRAQKGKHSRSHRLGLQRKEEGEDEDEEDDEEEGEEENTSFRIALYLHGGGYYVGKPEHRIEIAIEIARCSLLLYQKRVHQLATARDEGEDIIGRTPPPPVVVVVPEFSLAPEASHPQIVREVLATLRFCKKRIGPNIHKEVTLIGDAAGAHLAMSVVQTIRNTGYKRIPKDLLFVVGLYPTMSLLHCNDDGKEVKSRKLYGGRGFFYTRSIERFYDAQIRQRFAIADRMDDLPPHFVVTAQHSMVRDENRVLVRRMRKNGVETEYICLNDQVFGFASPDISGMKVLTNVAKLIVKKIDERWSAE